MVEDVVAGSAAEKAGLRRHDVLLTLDGEPIREEAERRLLSSFAGYSLPSP